MALYILVLGSGPPGECLMAVRGVLQSGVAILFREQTMFGIELTVQPPSGLGATPTKLGALRSADRAGRAHAE